VAERAEAFNSVIRPHTACTDAAEWKIILRDVRYRAA